MTVLAALSATGQSLMDQFFLVTAVLMVVYAIFSSVVSIFRDE